MKTLTTYILTLLCLLLPFYGAAQKYDPKKVCRLDNGNIIFKLDKRWNPTQKKEIGKLFDLDSQLLAKAFQGLSEFTIRNEKWMVKKIDQNTFELSKVINNTPVTHVNSNDIFIMDEFLNNNFNVVLQENTIYGANDFKNNSLFQYRNHVARFFIPGQRQAKRIYLSGSFNNWTTTQLPLQKNDSGWSVSVKLPPGKYQYKYIIDGHWIQDPNNNLGENDYQGGKNSVLYCFNHIFQLPENRNAKKVVLAGSFNGFNKKEIRMYRTTRGWAIPLYLKEGTYTYKFIVDGNWVLDPTNKITRNDGKGNVNSVLGIGDPFIFQLKGYTTSLHVYLAGNFNGWNPNELEMEKTPTGWRLPYILAPGMYEYKFIVNDRQWIVDPDNPYSKGPDDYRNSLVAVKPNHTFVLKQYPNAYMVAVAGSFNNWNENEYFMSKKDGKWFFPIYLPPGKHTYKFIVDRKWIIDPNNKLFESNDVGSFNSILWMEQ